jgi:hypothetical protein
MVCNVAVFLHLYCIATSWLDDTNTLLSGEPMSLFLSTGALKTSNSNEMQLSYVSPLLQVNLYPLRFEYVR